MPVQQAGHIKFGNSSGVKAVHWTRTVDIETGPSRDRGRMARRSDQNSIRSSPSIPSIRSKSDGAGPGVRSTVMYATVWHIWENLITSCVVRLSFFVGVVCSSCVV